MAVGGQRYGSAAFPLEKTGCSLHRSLGGTRDGSRLVRKRSPLPAFYLWTVQPVARVAIPTVPSGLITDILKIFSFINRPILKFWNEVCIAGEDEQGGILIGHIIGAGSKTRWHSREGINKNNSVNHRHSRVNKQVALERSGKCIF